MMSAVPAVMRRFSVSASRPGRCARRMPLSTPGTPAIWMRHSNVFDRNEVRLGDEIDTRHIVLHETETGRIVMVRGAVEHHNRSDVGQAV